MSTYLITGASRGLGLALTKILSSLPPSEVKLIFATSRQSQPSSLNDLAKTTSGRVVPICLDPNDPASLKSAVEQVEEHIQKNGATGLDVLINNAGILDSTDGRIENMENPTEIFNTNVTLTHLVIKAFMPLLRQGRRKVVANVSTGVASISTAENYQAYNGHGYKISKAALNMLTKLYAADYGKDGFAFFSVSPGWLRTDMGGENADLPVEVGAAEVAKMAREAGPGYNGRFLNIYVPGWEGGDRNVYDGKDIPW